MASILPAESGRVIPKNSIFGMFHPLDGFHGIEEDELGPFVWTRKRFQIRKPPTVRFVEVNLCYYGDKGRLVARGAAGSDHCLETVLHKGWRMYCLDLQCASGADLEFEVDPLIRVQADSRELGVMIRSLAPLQDQEQYEFATRKASNRQMNMEEFWDGKPLLHSHAPQLRIDIETRCNLNPRCTYCRWDWSKSIEKDSPLLSLMRTISGLDEFLTYADQIVDCGCGEPLLNPNLPQMLDELALRRIRLEMTSNGVLLTRDIRKMLLGRQLTLYVSTDSATEQGYRRYRHASLNKILNNLRALCTERKDYRGLPRIMVSFIAMSSNLGEFEQFLERMIATGVDAIKIRSLFCDPEYVDVHGWTSFQDFDYRREMLDAATLGDFLGKAKALARNAGMPLASEHDFNGDLETEQGPICREPWQSLYVLNRGIMHCCFAKSPAFSWKERGERALGEFVRDAWNSSVFQEIRTALAQRQLHDYCLKAKSCPIVKKWNTSQTR